MGVANSVFYKEERLDTVLYLLQNEELHDHPSVYDILWMGNSLNLFRKER